MAKSFTLQLQAFAAKAGVTANLVVAKTGLEMHSRMVQRTPVDTGRARGNWTISVGAIDSGVRETTDARAFGAPPGTGEAAKLAGFKAGKAIYIQNNLPYIEELENGSSKQSPSGMAGVTVLEFEGIVRQIAQGAAK